ncbi:MULTISPECIES: flagellin N-terminal helical domain-containing protein [Chitinibacter]|jgi:flagellin|uniref:flagellin N-terminal helical domain-containing protein n=1 Tax=Chitinibacter TaxID=230666 RepID=UPI0003FC404B|nr:MULTISPECIES: flagellin [Chitinibacter]
MQVINTNVPSLNSQRNLAQTGTALSTSLTRLSSGLRINSAKDDAAGLAISERMTSQIKGLDQARRNANDGISLSQTAEGALQSSGDILQRIRELAVQSVNGSNSGSDRQALNSEVSQLVTELDRISNTTEFNGLKLLNGSFGSMSFQVGANANQTINVGTADVRTDKYGLSTFASASAAAPTSATAYTSGTVTVGGIKSKDVAVTATDTAKTLADKINAVNGETGVSASARTLATLDFSASGAYSLEVTSSNTSAVTVSFSVSNTNTSEGLAQAVSEINKVSSQTGVTAKVSEDGTEIRLENSTGANLQIGSKASSASGLVFSADRIQNDGTYQKGASASIAAGTSGTAGLKAMGYVALDSANGFSITDAATGIFGTGVADQTNKVNTLDISTAEKATSAIRIVDAAIQTINSSRATYGAAQSRFETTIKNLQTTSENLSASRSRIRDTDFANETANLTRAQVLQQAGTAMLAQANALPNQVLSLLRG